MRKLFLLLCYSVALLLFVTACKDTGADDSSNFKDTAVELGEEFIKEFYTVDELNFDFEDTDLMLDYSNAYSTYLTEEEFEDLSAKRFFIIPQEVANKQNRTITVQNIKFERDDGDQEESNSIDLEQTFTLIFTDQEGNTVDEVDMKGQMTVVDTENRLKIDRYYDGQTLVDMLYP
ncbi:hypothetical protein ACTWPF_18650 [Oceanobacillus sp. M65]|uniref:hypothetical protein n=1 Tax=Oceanobacillus sp. M65 TaxID=3457435 RepID=UPI003FCD93F1